ncbi:Rubrerythrin-1 [Nymphon striatum]|nr:Rubrerythrin-1 [Nymphon striatum]
MAELAGTETHENLKAAFAGESQANRRYLYFAKVADAEGYPDIASNFRSTAEGETGHALGHLDYMSEAGDPVTGQPIGTTQQNLTASLTAETHEYTDMYPAMAKTARDEGPPRGIAVRGAADPAVSRLVGRDDIVDYATYNDTREEQRPAILREKKKRRIHIHEHLTLLFENRDTLRYQIQEIMRAERIVREADIEHEIGVYNAILGDQGDLGAVLLIEIADAALRNQLLREWVGLQSHVYVELADGSKKYASFDPMQVGDDRLSAVQYLRFAVQGATPVAAGIDFEHLDARVDFTTAQVTALAQDLAQT